MPRFSTSRGVIGRGFALALLALLPACGDDGPAAPDVPDEIDPAVAEFVTAVNEHRVGVGCPALAWDAAVAAVAQGHSEDMVARSFFSHTNPEGDSPGDRLLDAGISLTGWAENIAYGYSSAESVLGAWLSSSGHRANIENCSLTVHGVGLEGTYWTHVFIRP